MAEVYDVGDTSVLVAQSGAASGAGVLIHTSVSAALAAQSGQASGDANSSVTGIVYDLGATITLFSQPGQTAGSGQAQAPGVVQAVYDLGTTVALAAQPATVVSQTNANIHEDIGAPAELVAQSATVSALGGSAIVGTSLLLGRAAQVVVVTEIGRVGAGVLLAQAAETAGISDRVNYGTGALVAESALVSSVARKTSIASGALIADVGTTVGTGVADRQAQVALVADYALLNGVAGHSTALGPIGSGLHTSVGSAEITAVATLRRSSASDLMAGAAEMTGVGGRFATAITANLVAQSAVIELDAASEDLMTWEGDDSIWSQPVVAHARDWPVFVLDREFYQADFGSNFDSEPVRVVLERTGLTLFGRDRQGNWKTDPTLIKFVSGVWPLVRGAPGALVKVRVGSQMSTEDPIDWEGPYDFRVGQDNFLDFTVSGRYIALRFESEGQDQWELISYDLDLEVVGAR